MRDAQERNTEVKLMKNNNDQSQKAYSIFFDDRQKMQQTNKATSEGKRFSI